MRSAPIPLLLVVAEKKVAASGLAVAADAAFARATSYRDTLLVLVERPIRQVLGVEPVLVLP